MIQFSSKIVFILFFYLISTSVCSNRQLEDEVIDDCIEFITDIIPVRLENLKEPIDYSNDVMSLGYYQPRTKYEFKVCKEDDLDDCQLRYSDKENYTVLASDRNYKKVTERYELHGRSINRTHSYIFKYKSVKLKLDEGLIIGENGEADSCKEGYRSCGKFNVQFKAYKNRMLCFPWAYDCPYKKIKGAVGDLSEFTEHIKLEDSQTLNLVRYTEKDIITTIFTGFFYYPFYQKENLDNLPFTFTNLTFSSKESVFTQTIDLRELLKENNIYSHFLDFYFKDVKIDSNSTFKFSLSVKFQNIWQIEAKCGVKKELREEYVFDNYDNDCLTMIEHIRPKRLLDSTEKFYERDVLELAHYIPKFQYEHILCKSNNKSICKFRHNNDSIYEKIYDDDEYDLINSTYIGNTDKKVYIYFGRVFQYDKLNINFKESFDPVLYKCKDGYRACARIKHHPMATLLCVPNSHYCPFNDIIGSEYLPDPYYKELYPFEFGYYRDRDVISFHYSRYKMNDTLDFISKGVYLRNGLNDENFNKLFPFYLSVYKKGAKPILAYQDREIIMDIIFRQNGIPNNYIQYTFPNEYNIQDDEKDGKTKMYLSAEVEHYKHVELKCEESSTNNEIILYTALSLNETSNENQTTSNEITTDKAETKTNIPAENTNKAETKTDIPAENTNKAETKTNNTDVDENTYVDPYVGQCFVEFCQTCQSSKSYYCSRCQNSNYEINSASGSCVLKTESNIAISFVDIFGYLTKSTKKINNRPYTGPFFKMKGLTCSKVNSKHAFSATLIFKLNSRLRYLEDNTINIPTICEIVNPVSQSSSNINSVNYECIGEKEVTDKYELSDIQSKEIILDYVSIQKNGKINKQDSTYNEENTVLFTLDDISNIKSNNTKFAFSLSGTLYDKKNVLSDTKNVQLQLKDRTEKVYCDFTKGSNQNAVLDCKLTIYDSFTKKRMLSITDIQFKDNLVKIGNSDVYMNKLDEVHLIQDPDYQEPEENANTFYRTTKSSSSHTALIVSLSVIGGIIAIGAVIAVAICLAKRKNNQHLKAESTVNSMAIDNLKN